MKALHAVLLVALLTLAAVLPAAEPVAIRVEVEPLGSDNGGSRVAVLVRVAPEDRGRIGRNAMVRIGLDGAPAPGQSPLWAVRVADDGSARVETVWPPGEHRLELEIASPSGAERGLWVGTVRVPGVVERLPGAGVPGAVPGVTPAAPAVLQAGTGAPAAVETPVPGATPEPAAAAAAVAEAPPETVAAATEPEAAAVASAAAATGEAPVAEPAPEPIADTELQPVPPEAEGAAIAGAAALAAAPGALGVQEPAPGLHEAPGAGGPPASAAAPETASAPEALANAAVAEAAAAVSVGREAVPETAPERGGAAVGPAPEAASEPTEAATVLVEPLRGAEPQPVGAETDADDAGHEPAALSTASAATAARPPAPAHAVDAAALGGWAGADPETRELTAVVLEGREAVPGLSPADLRLRLGGAEVPIAAVAGRDAAPLLLGIALDAAGDSGIGWPGAGGPLGALVARAAGGGGRVFFAAPGLPAGDWDAGPPAALAGGGGDLASLVVTSLDRLAGARGRRFLLLVSDGRSEPDKDAWQRALDAADAAGTPVLVVALWDERFSQRTRKQLRELAEVSGGSLFLVQGRGQLDRAAERFGPLLDAGVSVRFRMPAGVALPAAVRLEGARDGLEVATAKRLR